MSFSTSLSGLRASNIDLNVTSNNIANAATTGFKESRAEFADIYQGNAYGIAKNDIGTGVRVADIAQQFKQGNINTTGNILDLAISGQGFFNVSNNGTILYTRSGNFQMDDKGYIVTPQGYRVRVFPPNDARTGVTTGSTVDLQLQTTDSAPKQTSNISVGINLPAYAEQPKSTPFNPKDTNSYNQATSLSVYDSLGVSHVLTLYYVKTATPNQWQQYAYVDGNSVSASPQTIQYSNSGTLTSLSSGSLDLDSYTPQNGAGPLTIHENLLNSTQYGDAFAVNNLTQDGFAAGRLSTFDIDRSGAISARYSNGANQLLGQIALTNFNNEQGLAPLGNNVWAANAAAGTPRNGSPSSSDFGQIESGALEASTVDLTEQLVNMIIAQRNFEANSKMISTENTVTQTAINIDR